MLTDAIVPYSSFRVTDTPNKAENKHSPCLIDREKVGSLLLLSKKYHKCSNSTSPTIKSRNPFNLSQERENRLSVGNSSTLIWLRSLRRNDSHALINSLIRKYRHKTVRLRLVVGWVFVCIICLEGELNVKVGIPK